MTCLPASRAARAIVWRRADRHRLHRRVRQQRRRIAVGPRARHAQAALARHRDQFEGIAGGDYRQMLVLRDLAQADDADAVPHATLPSGRRRV
jgi:hypothetical protein